MTETPVWRIAVTDDFNIEVSVQESDAPDAPVLFACVMNDFDTINIGQLFTRMALMANQQRAEKASRN